MVYNFTAEWSALPSTTTYNWFVWLTNPGAGWSGVLWSQNVAVTLTNPTTTRGPTTTRRATTTALPVTTTVAIASPCGATAAYCVDVSTIPLSISRVAGTYSVAVKVWSKTALDAFVELHETNSLALVSNYAYSAITASTTSAYTTYRRGEGRLR
ncbi:hypothetical protein M427DRAFT_343866 [Gonapodya prolifera JEL478]|uniref:Uncharacterized protein n=1 Tax=Gonapodya prolifera (strain JEL478) TaxID=1344416 RepID=A0A139AVI8_GONPJ|nr:hypothetical protein M427DRAFT_343866 [Gonapodya prolifera JEL478]|eukprot:KXS20740.1 hypothetical protein M427DRAFT_343866 [Gonapodya prolifera JEL478]